MVKGMQRIEISHARGAAGSGVVRDFFIGQDIDENTRTLKLEEGTDEYKRTCEDVVRQANVRTFEEVRAGAAGHV